MCLPFAEQAGDGTDQADGGEPVVPVGGDAVGGGVPGLGLDEVGPAGDPLLVLPLQLLADADGLDVVQPRQPGSAVTLATKASSSTEIRVTTSSDARSAGRR
ncbi:hypothetical protein [Kutzneria kofuensis]|uniref:hypothetical protein n=1 Tax=Kutzneria kofuensis TaxID=103725 RepID=UPI0031EB7B65